MRCFADCTLSHPLDLLRLGGDKSWKRLGEKILEYRTNLDNNRKGCVTVSPCRYHVSTAQLRSDHRGNSSSFGNEDHPLSDVQPFLLPTL